MLDVLYYRKMDLAKDIPDVADDLVEYVLEDENDDDDEHDDSM